MTSTIKVNTVKDTASTDIIKKCGTSITVGTASDTTTVAGNAVRSNAIQASDGQNIISQTGTTITLGASGDTIALSAGANQTGFGRTGTVDWQTGSIKTSTFTAVSGEGYFCNTSGGSFSLILPSSPSAGDIVALKDYALTFDTNALSIDRNGSLINGTAGTTLSISTEGASIVLVFVDATKGWIPTQDDESALVPTTPTFITATGGTISTVDTNFKVHTFTGPGTFTVCSVGNPAGSNEISYVIIGGGASGARGNSHGGGGGAGGYREGKSPQDSYTASPIACTSGSNNGIPVTAQGYPIVIGGGGGPTTSPGGSGADGNPSSAFSLTSARGGGGGAYPGGNGSPGASGGGDGGNGTTGGTGNTPPTNPPQGNPSGTGASSSGGSGGGGATTAGNPPSSPVPSKGGTGATSSISGAAVERAGGGGGGGCNSGPASGGGGIGGVGSAPGNTGGTGTINTGGGGGGNGPSPGNGGGGGSGIVMIRYKFQ